MLFDIFIFFVCFITSKFSKHNYFYIQNNIKKRNKKDLRKTIMKNAKSERIMTLEVIFHQGLEYVDNGDTVYENKCLSTWNIYLGSL